MKYYFQLQLTLLNRLIREIGVRPELGYLLGLIAFLGFSFVLFNQIAAAEIVYMMTALYYVSKLSEVERNNFLSLCFSRRQYYTIRLLENIAASLFFIGFLIFQGYFLYAGITFLLSLVLATVRLRVLGNFSLPTPFSRKPFEFATGFRRTFAAVITAFILCVIAIQVNNFNLGVGSLLILALIAISFYSEPEKDLFVWIYKLVPSRFLIMKCGIAVFHYSILSLPFLIVLAWRFPEHILILVVFFALAWFYLIAFVLAKYSAYPDKMNIAQAIVLIVAFWFPPLLLVVIPYLFNKSVQKINRLLT
jgi:hypothetical protein